MAARRADSRRLGGRRRPAAWVPVFWLYGLWLAGCQAAPPVAIGTPDRAELRRRAENLLLRAAASENPELACNAIEALVHVAPEKGLPHFRAALLSEYPLLRFAGLVALGTLRDRTSIPAYRARLSDENAQVRLAAAFALYRCGKQGAARVLVDALRDHPDENVRAEAAHLIGLLEEPRALKQLQAASRRTSETSDKVLVQIYAAMARLGDDTGVQRLIEYTPGAAITRLMAVQALAEIAPPQAREALEQRLGPAEDYLVCRLLAARGLARLGSFAGYDLAMKNLRYSGNNPDDPEEAMRVKTNAALVLGEIKDPRALPALRRLAEEEQDPRVQVAACYAICRIVGADARIGG